MAHTALASSEIRAIINKEEIFWFSKSQTDSQFDMFGDKNVVHVDVEFGSLPSKSSSPSSLDKGLNVKTTFVENCQCY